MRLRVTFESGRFSQDLSVPLLRENASRAFMRLTIDTSHAVLTYERDGQVTEIPLYSRESFEIIGRQWLRVGWDQKYTYTFSWLGRPVIQLPEDLIRSQEVIHRLKPDVIVETGVAHGGSLVFYATLCRAIGHGRVIGIDVDIRPQNRSAIENHELAAWITLVQGSSVDPRVVAMVESKIQPDEVVLVFLDSCHTKGHVAQELEAYSGLIRPGSYIVATDGIMADLCDVPRGKADWKWDNPAAAAAEFVVRHPEFELEQPIWPFNESNLRENVTHWTAAWLRRL